MQSPMTTKVLPKYFVQSTKVLSFQWTKRKQKKNQTNRKITTQSEEICVCVYIDINAKHLW